MKMKSSPKEKYETILSVHLFLLKYQNLFSEMCVCWKGV